MRWGLAGLLGAVAAVGLAPKQAWAQGLERSKHDLSSMASSAPATASPVAAAGTTNTEFCKYCHTPHVAQSSHMVWNHSQTGVTTWSWGNSLDGNALGATLHGTPLPTTLRNESKICLGCHDGTVALGDVSNMGGGVAGVLPGLNGITGFTDPSGRLIDAPQLVGDRGNLGGNHPVSIPYAGQTYNSIASKAVADGSPGNYYPVVTSSCTSPSGICTAAPTTDGRNGAAINLVPEQPGLLTNVGVECGTCHEPHNQFSTRFFMRVDSNGVSGLCRSCHNQ